MELLDNINIWTYREIYKSYTNVKISCHWTQNEHWRLHFVSLTNATCELEWLSEKHCSLKATYAVRDTNTFERITLKSSLSVNCKPPHALYLIQNTKPMHSHSPTHTTNRGDTVNHFTFNLTFSRLSVFCNTEETINFYRGAVFFFLQQTKKDKQWLLDTTSLSPVRTVQFSSTDRWTHRASSHPNIPQTAHICVSIPPDTRWAFADFSIFANLSKLQP